MEGEEVACWTKRRAAISGRICVLIAEIKSIFKKERSSVKNELL